ncbi:C40 family peptidase [Pseudoclavibacter soli]|uniref:C40 family peptidase n=1 Tax=Pseudoclavibacter soli TaxID=452623 RepID=UPI000419D177|nr:C40 family peptidase [Pseudoclavibacter soli]
MASRVLTGLVGGAFALASVFAMGLPAVADVDVSAPTWDEVRAAESDQAQRTAMQQRIQQVLDAYDAEYQSAASSYQSAAQAAAVAQQTLGDTVVSFVELQEQIEQAKSKAEQSKRQAGSISVQLYRSGGIGTGTEAAAIASVEDPDAALKKMAALDRLGGQFTDTLDSAVADANTLQSLSDTLEQQKNALQDLSDQAQTKADTAAQAQSTAYSLYSGQSDQVVQLSAQLAELQGRDAEAAAAQVSAQRAQTAASIAPVAGGTQADEARGAVTPVATTPSTSSSSSSGTTTPAATTPSTPGSSSSSSSSTSGSSASSGSSSAGSSSSSSSSSRGAAVVATARLYLGVPYVWGGTTPAGFDCSGFTNYVYAKNGISLPRVSQSQMNSGRAISYGEAQPGDLVWMNSGGHVGIYLGGGMVIHASKPGDFVKISPVSVWSDAHFRRLW